MEYKWLAISDADAIHEYVFSPHELKLIRGGSNLQGSLHEKVAEIALGQQEENVIFRGGGTVLAKFLDCESRDRFCRLAEEEYRRQTAIATTTTAFVPYNDPAEFHVALQQLRDQLETRKLARVSTKFNGGAPFWVGCASCGLYPATAESNPPERQLICDACRLREANGRRKAHEPEDFDDIAEKAEPKNYLAVVYIDVDGLGKLLNEHARTEERYRELSTAVDNMVRQATRDACKHAANKYQILLAGGDDAVVALPAGRAIRFLREFARRFDAAPFPVGCPRPTFSVGLVIAHSHFPIAEFVRIAEELLRSAKTIKGRHAVDYAILTESMSGEIVNRRETGFGRPVTFKPYALGPYQGDLPETGPQQTFFHLNDAVVELKRVAAASQVKSLYRIAHQGPLQAELEYLYLLSRLESGAHRQLLKTIGQGLWQRRNGVKATNATDVVELLEFADAT